MTLPALVHFISLVAVRAITPRTDLVCATSIDRMHTMLRPLNLVARVCHAVIAAVFLASGLFMDLIIHLLVWIML